MRKRLAYELANLREAFPEEYVIDDYPADLLLPFRRSIDCDENGWHALAIERDRLDFRRLQSQGAVDMVFHHLTSGIMLISPSLASGLRWRVIYPSDAILCSPCYENVSELIAIRYEITPPRMEWLGNILREETPWVLASDSEEQFGELGDLEI